MFLKSESTEMDERVVPVAVDVDVVVSAALEFPPPPSPILLPPPLRLVGAEAEDEGG